MKNKTESEIWLAAETHNFKQVKTKTAGLEGLEFLTSFEVIFDLLDGRCGIEGCSVRFLSKSLLLSQFLLFLQRQCLFFRWNNFLLRFFGDSIPWPCV